MVRSRVPFSDVRRRGEVYAKICWQLSKSLDVFVNLTTFSWYAFSVVCTKLIGY